LAGIFEKLSLSFYIGGLQAVMKIFRNRQYEFTVSNQGFNLSLCDGASPFLASSIPLLLYPQIENCRIDPGSVRCEPSGESDRPVWSLQARMTGNTLAEIRNRIYFLDDRLVCEADYTANQAHGLAAWNITPAGSRLDCERIHTLSGHHGGHDENGTWHSPPDVEFSSITHNWTYAGAAPRILFYRGQLSMLIGGTRLSGDYGLQLKTKDGAIEHFCFDYGGQDRPLPCKSGERIRGPRLQMQCGLNLIPEQAQSAFTQSLIADGLVMKKHYAPEDRVWRRPWYCTWADQMGISQKALAQDQSTTPSCAAIKAVLTQQFVEKAAKFIRDRDLNIGTIIIDAGWEDYIGDWNLMTDKFPDMRGLVNQLHDWGFQAVLWWAPFFTETGAKVLNRPEFAPGPTRRHNQRVIDYSRPEVCAWIEEKLETWFGSGTGCWDFDGMKLDFMLEKIYPDSQFGDTSWRGEETCFHHLFQMIDRVIRRHKPSPGILHVPFNPMFAPFCAAVHTEERFDTDLDYIFQRPALADAMLPGTWFAPHFNYNPKAVPEFIRRVKRAGGIVQVGKLLSPDVTPKFICELKELLIDAG
jgi:hypothetical protein